MNGIAQVSNLIIIIFTALTGILAFIEKSQAIKWKPISKLFIGNIPEKLDKLNENINNIDKKVDNLRVETKDDIADSIRSWIIDFSRDYARHRSKTEQQLEEFDRKVEKYESICKEINKKNTYIDECVYKVSFIRKEKLKIK